MNDEELKLILEYGQFESHQDKKSEELLTPASTGAIVN